MPCRCAGVSHAWTARISGWALYVAEGSALGGRELVRGLDRLFGISVAEGRKFFIGRGTATGEAWRAYLALLSAAQPEPSACAEIIKGAVKTFAVFEHWLNGWSTSSHG
jgi:heme oxygenase